MPPTSEYKFRRGSLTSRNRGFLAAMTNKQSQEDGCLTNAEINWLTRRAKDGFGVITTAASHVSENGKGWRGEMGVWSDSHLEGLTKLASNLRYHGSLSLVQIFHGGMKAPQDLIGQIPICPSEVVGNDGDETLSGTVDDPSRNDACGVAAEAHHHTQRLFTVGA